MVGVEVYLTEVNNYIGKQVLSKNTMSYIWVRGGINFALISVQKGNSIRGYEIWKIRAYSPYHKIRPNHIRFPSNEDFGKCAWFYSTLEHAKKRLEELENEI